MVTQQKFWGQTLPFIPFTTVQPGSATDHSRCLINLAYSSKIKNKTTTWSSNPPPGDWSKRIYLFIFLGLHPRHMEVSRLGVELELQLPAYTTATATLDPSHICDLHHSSRQCQILNPLSKARDQPVSSWILAGFVTTKPQWELPMILLFWLRSTLT